MVPRQSLIETLESHAVAGKPQPVSRFHLFQAFLLSMILSASQSTKCEELEAANSNLLIYKLSIIFTVYGVFHFPAKDRQSRLPYMASGCKCHQQIQIQNEQHVLTEDFPFLAEMALMIRIVYLYNHNHM